MPVTSNIYSVIPKPGFISLTIVHHTIVRVVFLEIHFRDKSSKRKSIREITVLFTLRELDKARRRNVKANTKLQMLQGIAISRQVTVENLREKNSGKEVLRRRIKCN